VFCWGGNPGVGRENVSGATGWEVRFAASLSMIPAPSEVELAGLRDQQQRTDAATGLDDE